MRVTITLWHCSGTCGQMYIYSNTQQSCCWRRNDEKLHVTFFVKAISTGCMSPLCDTWCFLLACSFFSSLKIHQLSGYWCVLEGGGKESDLDRGVHREVSHEQLVRPQTDVPNLKHTPGSRASPNYAIVEVWGCTRKFVKKYGPLSPFVQFTAFHLSLWQQAFCHALKCGHLEQLY